ncbi:MULTISPECIES: hypothetical protein [Okeania]|nr:MULTISPECIES: hypothetical protein [Okeania]
MARYIIWLWCIVMVDRVWGDGEMGRLSKDAEDIEGNIFLTVVFS